jgi:hypothetical protein
MATSPNYGWSEPDNTSLVKNGAQAMRTLGDAIDTSVWNVGYGQAGKNKIINGDFNINQRSFTSTSTNLAFGFDRFFISYSGGTLTNSAQVFATGAAPVAGYEGKNFSRLVTASQSAAGDFAASEQRIESVRTFAGQTVTVSMWAKASTGTPKIGISATQFFGSGAGSPSASVITSGGTATISNSWVRYSFTIAIPSISGKSIGAAGDDSLRIAFWTSAGTTISGLGYPAVGIQNVTIDTWGWQIEYGSKATPFQTASGGSPQAELAMCQRYYQVAGSYSFGGRFESTTVATIWGVLPVQMRTTPTLSYTSFASAILVPGVAFYTPTAVTFGGSTSSFQANFTGMTSGVIGNMATINVGSNLSAEL